MLLFIVKTVPNIADDNLQIFKNLYMLKNHIVFSDIFGRTECRIGPEISNRTKKCRIGHRIWPLYSLIMLTIFTVKIYLTHKLLLNQSKQNSK